MGRVFLHTDNSLDAQYTSKHGNLDLPAAPVHQQLHVIRDAVEKQTHSGTCNVVVAALGLVYSDAAHWTVANEQFKAFYHRTGSPTLGAAAAAKDARKNPQTPYDANFYQPMTAARKTHHEAQHGPVRRVWNYAVVNSVFCSGSRALHKTPDTVQVGAAHYNVIHREHWGDANRYEQLATQFNAAGGSFDRGHNASRDNHSEFHFAIWLHDHFVDQLCGLPAFLNVPAGAKIYAVTIDFVSTNAICATCARKLDALLTPGYLEALAEAYFARGYVTSIRNNTQGGHSGLRLVMRASAHHQYAGAPAPAEAGAAPIQVKSCYFDGSVTIHETNVIPT